MDAGRTLPNGARVASLSTVIMRHTFLEQTALYQLFGTMPRYPAELY